MAPQGGLADGASSLSTERIIQEYVKIAFSEPAGVASWNEKRAALDSLARIHGMFVERSQSEQLKKLEITVRTIGPEDAMRSIGGPETAEAIDAPKG